MTQSNLLKIVILSPCIADNASGESAPGLEFAVHRWKRSTSDLGPGHLTIEELFLLLPLLFVCIGEQYRHDKIESELGCR